MALPPHAINMPRALCPRKVEECGDGSVRDVRRTCRADSQQLKGNKPVHLYMYMRVCSRVRLALCAPHTQRSVVHAHAQMLQICLALSAPNTHASCLDGDP